MPFAAGKKRKRTAGRAASRRGGARRSQASAQKRRPRTSAPSDAQRQAAARKRRRQPQPQPRTRAVTRDGLQPMQAWKLEKRKTFDAPLLLVTLMLLGIGLIAILSASYPKAYYSENLGSFYYFIRQLLYAVVGLVGMYVVSCVPYGWYARWSWPLYVVSVAMLVAVLTPLGTTLNKSRRWLFGFQPSEIAKLAIILLFAYLLTTRPWSVHRAKGLLGYVALVGIVGVLLAKEPHMSAFMIIAIIAFAMLFVAGMRVWFVGPAIVAGVAVVVAAYYLLPHVQTRLQVWLDPFDNLKNGGWQAAQSLIAIGSGGAFGLGLGQSRQKFLYLPEPFNDFIFSVVCEELGFIGAGLILLLFAFFVYRGFSIAQRANTRFGALLATGITMQFAFQILLNLAVVSGLFPVTGASLPLFSYGGTALIMQLLEIGILLNISRNIPPSRKQ